MTDAPRDHFGRLGLAPSFAIDAAELQRRYVALQRQFHPDRYATRPANERAVALARASDLNQAYETLKSALGRAEYLLKLKGWSGGGSLEDPILLMEAMEHREALAEAEDVAAVAAVLEKAQAEIAIVEQDLARAFDAGDRDRSAALTAKLSYLTKLGEEARRRRLRLANAAAA